ncbi:MAG: RNA 2',3'-cyclic phosphodiesterase [Bacteroidota bacterium]
MHTLRLFVAVETPPSAREELGELRRALERTGAAVRWEGLEKMHITLKFLGPVGENLLPEAVHTLEEACRGGFPFRVEYAGIGAFPHFRSPRVIWAGVRDPRGGFPPLHRAVEEGYARIGFPREERPFHPHVTLGRVGGGFIPDRLLRTIESTTFESRTVEIRHCALVRSDLRPSGSVYTTLHRFPLGPSDTETTGAIP